MFGLRGVSCWVGVLFGWPCGVWFGFRRCGCVSRCASGRFVLVPACRVWRVRRFVSRVWVGSVGFWLLWGVLLWVAVRLAVALVLVAAGC